MLMGLALMVLVGGLGGAVLGDRQPQTCARRFPYGPFMLVGAALAVRGSDPGWREVSATDGARGRPGPCVKHWPHAALAHGGGVPRPRPHRDPGGTALPMCR